MLEDALEFPRNDEDWLMTIVIGAALSLLSFLFIPGLIVQGYLLRVARAAANGEETPPEFGEWVDLLVDGVKALVVAFVYGIVPATILIVGGTFLIGGAAVFAGGGSDAGAAGFGLLFVLFVFLMIPVLILIAYLTVVAQVRLAVTDSLGAAFEVGEVVSVGTDREFFVAFLIALGVGIVISLVGSALTAILVGFLVLFYGQVVMYYLFGRGYADATETVTV